MTLRWHLLRARPEVAAAAVQNGHLEIDLRQETDVAPLVSLWWAPGSR